MSPISFSRKIRSPRFRRGFALILTLMMMVLLTVIALGFLSLSTITLRAEGQGDAMFSARANARMALQLAIGQLQGQAGNDTRVTARADILDAKNPLITGVWKSWQGTDHETSGTFAGRPIPPGDYRAAKTARFLGWLASSSIADPLAMPDATVGSGKATLLGSGTVGSDHPTLQIALKPAMVTTGRQSGGIAWWVGGENQKARLPKPYQVSATAPEAGWAGQAKSHSVADTKPLRMEGLLADATPAGKAMTLREADFIATAAPARASRDFFHDLSTVSTGLLTNTATGGWRKDLSVLSENWASQPTTGMPMFRLTPAKDLPTPRSGPSNPLANGSMLYPWAAFRNNGSGPIYQHGAVTSWENMMDYATFYKRVSVSGTGHFTTSTVAYACFGDSGDSYNFLHHVRILPAIARVQWVFSHTAGGISGSTLLQPRLLLTPIITLWNPYNVEITSPPLSYALNSPIPAALRYTTQTNYHAVMGGGTNYQPSMGSSLMAYNIKTGNGDSLTLKPGETRLFSPLSATPVPSGTTIDMSSGYRSGGGYYYPVTDDSGHALALPSTTTIKADAKFDSIHTQVGAPGVGIYLDGFLGNYADPSKQFVIANRMICTPDIANAIYPPLTSMASDTLGHCKDSPTPFLSTMYGFRMASRTHVPAKGFVQSSPLVDYTVMGPKDVLEPGLMRHYGGTGNPVNAPFDFSFVKHTPGGDSMLPNSSDTTGNGYIVTGFGKSDGLSRCVACELPTRPLLSLGELVNWDLRYENPVPPYAINLIGNSDATPLLPSNAVVNTADASLDVNLQHDDSYCANHLLFDDWFFSSIAPDPTGFGAVGRIQRNVYTDFVTGKTPLPNRAYLAIPDDAAAASAGAAAAIKLYTDQVSKVDSWKTIASRLEVEGMFNVNSTSITAWRALLGHARKQQVPYYSPSGTSWVTKLSAANDYPLTRFSIAGDAKVGEASNSGAFPEANDFAGYRTLDEKFLDALAIKVVDQVRLRGPFLSLSEFVNRQLSSGDLALAGTLQSAMNNVMKTPATNPMAPIQALSTVSLAAPVRASDAEYKYPDAAVGYSGYGLPGWSRQADILRPIAPILSARDDTFTIRAYGDSRDAQGKIVASAVCEAVVRRTRDFIDSTDAANITTEPTSAVNKSFGRRFQIISYRWLTPGEI